MQVYRTALSATAVQALYRGGRGLYGQPAPDLIAGWHFDEGSGTTVADYSGNGRTGTLVHGPAWVPAAVASGAAVRDYRLRQLTYRDPLQALLQQHGYRYDRVGNITNWWQQDRHLGPWRWAATYDERDRLTGAAVRTSPTGVPAAFAYTYDAIGNITSGPLGAYTYGDPAHVHAATAAGTTHTYSYDANGAVLTRSEGATTYTHSYDVQGRQTSVAIAGGATSTFLYNGDGTLVARQVGGRTVAHYAAGGLYEVDPGTNTTRKYATFGGRRVAVTTTTAQPAATTTHYLHQDHLGSTGLVTTATGAFASARFHAPFGTPWYTPTTAAVAPALGTRFGEPWPAAGTLQAAPPVTDRHYTGQRSFEASLGSLYHYQARWYSPVLGRFLSPDPIVPNPANPQTLNRYAYVYNNPLKYNDPSGHCPPCVAVLVYAAMVAANTAVDTAIDYSIAQLTGDEFHLGQSLAVNAATNVALGGVGGIVGKARHLRHLQKLKNARIAQAAPNPETASNVAARLPGGVPSLSAQSLETIQGRGIKPHHLLKPRKGFHRHHLVEKRFWRQLGFESKEQAEKDILSAFLDAKVHGPVKGKDTITSRLRELIPYGKEDTRDAAALQKIWDAHKRVYREFGLNDLAEVVWDQYFRGRGVTK